MSKERAAAHEAVRQQVNTYIKSGVFDGYLDFDAAVTDNGNPPALLAAYDTWAQTDGLHLSPAGYQKLVKVADFIVEAPAMSRIVDLLGS